MNKRIKKKKAKQKMQRLAEDFFKSVFDAEVFGKTTKITHLEDEGIEIAVELTEEGYKFMKDMLEDKTNTITMLEDRKE